MSRRLDLTPRCPTCRRPMAPVLRYGNPDRAWVCASAYCPAPPQLHDVKEQPCR